MRKNILNEDQKRLLTLAGINVDHSPIITESKKLIKTITNGNKTVKIYKDTEWEHYVAKLFVDGVYNEAADYEDSYNRYDKQSVMDALSSVISTAEHMVELK